MLTVYTEDPSRAEASARSATTTPTTTTTTTTPTIAQRNELVRTCAGFGVGLVGGFLAAYWRRMCVWPLGLVVVLSPTAADGCAQSAAPHAPARLADMCTDVLARAWCVVPAADNGAFAALPPRLRARVAARVSALASALDVAARRPQSPWRVLGVYPDESGGGGITMRHVPAYRDGPVMHGPSYRDEGMIRARLEFVREWWRRDPGPRTAGEPLLPRPAPLRCVPTPVSGPCRPRVRERRQGARTLSVSAGIAVT